MNANANALLADLPVLPISPPSQCPCLCSSPSLSSLSMLSLPLSPSFGCAPSPSLHRRYRRKLRKLLRKLVRALRRHQRHHHAREDLQCEKLTRALHAVVLPTMDSALLFRDSVAAAKPHLRFDVESLCEGMRGLQVQVGKEEEKEKEEEDKDVSAAPPPPPPYHVHPLSATIVEIDSTSTTSPKHHHPVSRSSSLDTVVEHPAEEEPLLPTTAVTSLATSDELPSASSSSSVLSSGPGSREPEDTLVLSLSPPSTATVMVTSPCANCTTSDDSPSEEALEVPSASTSESSSLEPTAAVIDTATPRLRVVISTSESKTESVSDSHSLASASASSSPSPSSSSASFSSSEPSPSSDSSYTLSESPPSLYSLHSSSSSTDTDSTASPTTPISSQDVSLKMDGTEDVKAEYPFEASLS